MQHKWGVLDTKRCYYRQRIGIILLTDNQQEVIRLIQASILRNKYVGNFLLLLKSTIN